MKKQNKKTYSDCNQKQCGHYKTGTCKKCESCGAKPNQVDNKCQTCFDCEYKPGCVRWDNKDQKNTNEEKMSNEEAKLTKEMEKQIRKVFLEAIKNKFGKQMAKEVDEKIEKELLKEKRRIVVANSGDHECEDCSSCSGDQENDLMVQLKKMLEAKKNSSESSKDSKKSNSNKQVEVKRYKNYIG